MDKVDSASWKFLAEQKEKEWKSVLESRITALEWECQEKEKELISERGKFHELKEHFKYNLKLLEERDRELEKYDLSFSELRTSLNSKNAEISELKIHVDDVRSLLKLEEKTREELEANYQHRLREKSAEIDAYKSSKNGEIEEERKEYEQFRRNFQRQLTNIQNELDTQKREMTTDFENALKKREHEFRLDCDKLNAKVVEYGLKVKLLQKELELTRESSDETTAHAEEAESQQKELEKLLKQKDWELADISAVKYSQIAELQSKLNASEATRKTMQEDFHRKYIEMDKLAREKEAATECVKNGYLQQEQALQAVIQELQAKLEDAQIKERQLSWANQDLEKEKELQVKKLQEEIKNVKEKWDRHVAEISRENVNRDLELGTSLEDQRRLKLELEQRKADLDRYKRELKAAIEREEALDKAKVQTELDWQRRCEDLDRQQYQKSEELIQRLSTARNEAQALAKERERELHHQILLVKSLHRERDQLRALLDKHNIPLDSFVNFSLDKAQEDDDEEINLEKQNAALKQLIAQMRLQMESLGQDVPQSQTRLADVWGTGEEMSELQQDNHELKTSRKISSVLPIEKEYLSQTEGNVAIKNHIQNLNSSLGILRSEKVELAAKVKTQQARIAFLESSLEAASRLPRQKQIQVDQLTYELNSHREWHEGEVSGLKQRVNELELQLSQARREADEYHRASLERNDELVALGNQLSVIKMEMAEANPSLNFGAQELYIWQLQTELSQLRQRAIALDYWCEDPKGKANSNSKLRTAAAHIVQLAKENQHLMDSNNRLRAELKTAYDSTGDMKVVSFLQVLGADNPQARPTLTSTYGFPEQRNSKPNKSAGQSSEAMLNRLSQLEKLQYQLTRQELQFAQRLKSDHDTDQMMPERDTKAPHTSQSLSPDLHMQVSLSSTGADSIQKVWQMLEESSVGPSTPTARSPRSAWITQVKPSEQNCSSKKDKSSATLQLEGQQLTTENQPKKYQSLRVAGIKYAESMRKSQLKQHKPKVRNYNLRDESDIR